MREMDPGKGNGLYENLAEGKAGISSEGGTGQITSTAWSTGDETLG